MAAVALCCCLTATVHAQERTNAREVNPDQRQSGVALSLQLKVRDGNGFKSVCDGDCDRDLGKLPIGSQVAVCFKATADGYATVWNMDRNGGFDLIYPNKYSHKGNARGAAVKADTTTCIGEDNNFKLLVGPPAGLSQVYLHWTRTEAEQINPADYPVIGRDARSSPSYASTTLRYNAEQKK
ncbi:DUF4384 domain-containing protein [Rhodopseudomonas palustris]|nr:DUF4384 domain-containing protein [Rhodopseudomonas palustris]